jgi:hypothetical protein
MIKRTLERLRRKWENNITRDLEEITLGIIWTALAQNKVRWLGLTKTGTENFCPIQCE